jgi:hypothetical protein
MKKRNLEQPGRWYFNNCVLSHLFCIIFTPRYFERVQQQAIPPNETIVFLKKFNLIKVFSMIIPVNLYC